MTGDAGNRGSGTSEKQRAPRTLVRMNEYRLYGSKEISTQLEVSQKPHKQFLQENVYKL